MKKTKLWMIAAILICGTMTILTGCKSKPTADKKSFKISKNDIENSKKAEILP